MKKSTSMVVLGVLLIGLNIYAHKPLSNYSEASEFDGAIQIEDPAVSYVVYHEVTGHRPRVWLTFDGEVDFSFYISLGMPVLERLTDYRPAVAVIGPGLPEIELPFDIPSGLGGIIYTSEDVSEPRFFHEPFTGTDSWILVEEYLTLPESGTYYVVGYHPENTPGKLWVAPGKEEKWGIGDIIKLPSIIKPVREFHEVN